MLMASCNQPSTTTPSSSPSETTPITPTSSYTPPTTHPKITITSTPTSSYTPSGAIQERLQEVAQAFGRDIPIPTYLPLGYTITNAQFIQKQYSYDHVELTISASGKPDIEMSITWFRGAFRILPSSDDYQAIDISGGPGTYSEWAMFNFHNEHNNLWWDWIPGTFPSNSTSSPEFYDMVLSASIEVPPLELVNIARFVRIP